MHGSCISKRWTVHRSALHYYYYNFHCKKNIIMWIYFIYNLKSLYSLSFKLLHKLFHFLPWEGLQPHIRQHLCNFYSNRAIHLELPFFLKKFIRQYSCIHASFIASTKNNFSVIFFSWWSQTISSSRLANASFDKLSKCINLFFISGFNENHRSLALL